MNDTTSTERRHVLVVDDDPWCGKAVARLISLRHEATWVPSARDALARIEEGARFDLVLSDVSMPGMTGPELLAALTARAHPLADRFLLMSGDPGNDDCGPLSATPLAKPVDARELLAALDARFSGG